MIDREQRRYWQEERVRRALVPGVPGFARSGLMAHLDVQGALVTSLPSDPLRPALNLADASHSTAVLPDRLSGLTAHSVSTLQHLAHGNEAAVRFARLGQDDATWRAFAALRHDGSIEAGMGSAARFTFKGTSELAGRTGYRLFALVHALRVVVESQAGLLRLQAGDDLGPFELIVAIPDAAGAVLGGFAEGWAGPEHDFEIRTCLEPDLLLRHEVDPWPMDPDDQEELLVKVAARVCRSFSVEVDCFLPRLPAGVGQLSRGYA